MPRLLIHAGYESPAHGTPMKLAWRALLALYANCTAHRGPLSLQIDDLQGSKLLAVEDAAALTEVPLPAGTYHVIARRGRVRRRYTMTLEQGTFDLYLHLTADPL